MARGFSTAQGDCSWQHQARLNADDAMSQAHITCKRGRQGHRSHTATHPVKRNGAGFGRTHTPCSMSASQFTICRCSRRFNATNARDESFSLACRTRSRSKPRGRRIGAALAVGGQRVDAHIHIQGCRAHKKRGSAITSMTPKHSP